MKQNARPLGRISMCIAEILLLLIQWGGYDHIAFMSQEGVGYAKYTPRCLRISNVYSRAGRLIPRSLLYIVRCVHGAQATHRYASRDAGDITIINDTQAHSPCAHSSKST